MKIILFLILAITLAGCQTSTVVETQFVPEMTSVEKITTYMEQDNQEFFTCLTQNEIPVDNLTEQFSNCGIQKAQEGGFDLEYCALNPDKVECQAVIPLVKQWQQECVEVVEEETAHFYLQKCEHIIVK